MKKFWVITDTHFNHERIKQWGRPDDYEARIEKSLCMLGTDDILIHLGDINIGKDEDMHRKYIMPLDCRTWLIKGNHDGKSTTWYLEHGWDFVAETILLKFNGKRILFSHKPQPAGGYDLNIHGHLHAGEHRTEYDGLQHDKQKLVSLEKMGYHAFSLESLITSPPKVSNVE